MKENEVKALITRSMLYAENEVAVAKFVIDVYNNFFRLKVTVSDKSDTSALPGYPVNLPINRVALISILEYMKDKIIPSKEETELKVNLFRPRWVDNKMTDEKDLLGEVLIGKKEKDEGFIYYLGVKSTESDKHYKFKILPTPYVKLSKNGKELSDPEASEIWVKGYINNLLSMLDTFPDIYEFESRKPKKRNEVPNIDLPDI